MSDQKLGEELELECKPSVTACESNAQRIQLATDVSSFDAESSLLKKVLLPSEDILPMSTSFAVYTPFLCVHTHL